MVGGAVEGENIVSMVRGGGREQGSWVDQGSEGDQGKVVEEAGGGWKRLEEAGGG